MQILAWVVAAAWALGCAPHAPEPEELKAEAPAPRPSIVLISIDTLRSDRVPAYGYARGRMPAVDRLARDGVLFERAFAHVPLTLPSHASLLTGLLPYDHEVRDNVGFTLPRDRFKTVAGDLGEAGYATGGAVSSFVLRPQTGISQGFARYDAPTSSERPASETLDRLLPWLEEWKHGPFFLFFHLFEPHFPYRPPADLAAEFEEPYDAEVAAADRQVGRLLGELDRLGLYDSCLIVLLSDHGEGLGDHGEQEHGYLLYREAIQVPLILKLPGGERAGERVTDDVGLVDVSATLRQVSGVAQPPRAAGRSLLEPREQRSRPVYSETFATSLHFGWSELVSAVEGEFHYIDSPRPELYDLGADPAETRDLVNVRRRQASELGSFTAAVPRQVTPPGQTDDETREQLAALGYVGESEAATRASSTERLNPVDEMPKLAPLLAGIRLFYEGRYDEAVAELEPLVEARPHLGMGWYYLARALEALGRANEADAAMARSGAAGDSDAFLKITGAMRLLELGRPEDALKLVREELERLPQSGELRVVESRALMVLGSAEEALAAADEAVRVAPRLADARYQRAVVEMRLGRIEAAEADLREAVRLRPRHVQSLKALAVLRYQSGDAAEARALFERVVAVNPDDKDALEGIAIIDGSGR